MNTNAKFLKETVSNTIYDANGSMNLDTCYELTVSELALQQSKRDQIIAFYLTILGFVIPNVISLDISNSAKAVAFLAMYFIGLIFCHVILRYRIYKEVYWIACRVISQMYNILPESRDHEVIYTLFFNALKKNAPTIVIKNKDGKNSFFKSYRRQLNSAETLLYEALALFATFVGCISAWYAWNIHWGISTTILLFLLYMLFRINYKYTTRLMALYKCVDTKEEKDLENTFAKAWMLHCYVDDILD